MYSFFMYTSVSDLNLLFWTENLVVVDAANVEGKCVVLPFDVVTIQLISLQL